MKNFSRGLSALLFLLAICQSASAWTITQNFDDKSVGASCGWDSGSGSTVSSAMAFSGSKSCKLTVTAGQTAFGTWGGIIVHPSAVKRGGEIWVRVRTYMPAGFNYDSNGEGNHLKFLRVHTRSDATENLGYNDIYINPKGTIPPFQFIYEGEQVWSMIGALTDVISLGGWETYEFYVKLDTVPVSKGGSARAIFWKNGLLMADIKDRVTLSSTAAYSDRTHLFTYWNGGAPATESMYVDDVIVTTDTPATKDLLGNPYIGMGAAKSPNPPASVNVQ